MLDHPVATLSQHERELAVTASIDEWESVTKDVNFPS